jgi:UrcA family protein
MLPYHKINLRLFALLVIPTLLIAESGMAVARGDETPSVTVRYHDLNLDSQKGVANLYERIHAAAVVVCKSTEGPQLVNRVHNEKLSAYHWERSRGWKLRSVATLMSDARP